MFSWIATRLFYAIVFFLFGAWTASVSPHFKSVMRHASHAGAQGFDKMRDWTSSTLMPTPDVTKRQPDRPPAAVVAPASKAPQAPARVETETKAPAAQKAQAPAANAPPAQAAATTQAPAPVAPQALAPIAPRASAVNRPQASTAPAAGDGDLLTRAREAYARRDAAAAINAYRAFIDRNPAAIDARGELGNVFFAEGRKHEAAQMYSECGKKLLESGNVAGAIAMLDPLFRSDPAAADDLMRRIDMEQQNRKN